MAEKSRRLKLQSLEKTRDTRYLKNYTLTYRNKAGKEKHYEIVSRNNIEKPEQLGRKSSGVSIVAFTEDRQKILLLKEFRMGVNSYVINNVAGMIEPGETIEECISRELYEEAGIELVKIIDILPPAFAAVAISDTKTNIAYVLVREGELTDHTSDNEDIIPKFYTKEEVKNLLRTEEFSARTQIVCYEFCNS